MSNAVKCVCGGEFVEVEGRRACQSCGASLMSLVGADETQSNLIVASEPEQTDPMLSGLTDSLGNRTRSKRRRPVPRKTTKRRRKQVKLDAVAALEASVSEAEEGPGAVPEEAAGEDGRSDFQLLFEVTTQEGLSTGWSARLFQRIYDSDVSEQTWEEAAEYAAHAADHELLRLLVVARIDAVTPADRARFVGRFVEYNPVVFLAIPEVDELWGLCGGTAAIAEHRPGALDRLNDVSIRSLAGRRVLADIRTWRERRIIETAEAALAPEAESGPVAAAEPPTESASEPAPEPAVAQASAVVATQESPVEPTPAPHSESASVAEPVPAPARPPIARSVWDDDVI